MESHHHLKPAIGTLDDLLLNVELILDVKLNAALGTDYSNCFHVVVMFIELFRITR